MRIAATLCHAAAMDDVLEFMKEHNIPLTIIEVSFMSPPPKGIDAEQEAALPAQCGLRPGWEEFD